MEGCYDSASNLPMPEFCDVAVPVPLHMVLTYRLPQGPCPESGSRVIVPFRRQRLAGVVTELHDRAPKVTAKTVLQILDETPALSGELLRLGKWISEYYLAPVGEVFRSMLPLNAEFRRAVVYRITEEGHTALHLAGSEGSSARSKKTPQDQDTEYRALDYLAIRNEAREETLRSATRISPLLLEGMVRKKWIAREDVSHTTDASRTRQVAVLKSELRSGGGPRPPQQRDRQHLPGAGLEGRPYTIRSVWGRPSRSAQGTHLKRLRNQN